MADLDTTTPAGGILSGLMLAYSMKQQRDQLHAEEAIRRADAEWKQKQYALDSRRLDLQQQEETRLASSAQALQTYREGVLQQGEDRLRQGQDRLDAQNNRFAQSLAFNREKFGAIQDANTKKLILDQVARAEQGGLSQEEAFNGVMNLYNAVGDTLPQFRPQTAPEMGLQSALPASPDLRPQQRSPMDIRGNGEVSGLRGEPLPMVSDRMAQIEENTNLAIQKRRQLDEMFPEKKLALKLSNQAKRLGMDYTKEKIKFQKILNDLTPEQLRARIQLTGAQVADVSARRQETLQQIATVDKLWDMAKRDGTFVVTKGGSVQVKPGKSGGAVLNQLYGAQNAANRNLAQTLSALAQVGVQKAQLKQMAAAERSDAARMQYEQALHQLEEHEDQLQAMADNQGASVDNITKRIFALQQAQNEMKQVTPDTIRYDKQGRPMLPGAYRRPDAQRQQKQAQPRPNRANENQPKRTLKPAPKQQQNAPVYSGKGFKIFKE